MPETNVWSIIFHNYFSPKNEKVKTIATAHRCSRTRSTAFGALVDVLQIAARSRALLIKNFVFEAKIEEINLWP